MFAATLPIMVSVAALPIMQVGSLPCIDKRCTTLMIHSRQFYCLSYGVCHGHPVGDWWLWCHDVFHRGPAGSLSEFGERLLAAGLRVS